MNSNELRTKFLDFFKEKGHKVLPSASLVPENDRTVLFTAAGMQQFKRYYANPSLAPAARIATVQKCLRTSDIDEVGDSTHLTFFEMLGNFSFGYPESPPAGGGSYFKKEAIAWAWEFLTGVLRVDKSRMSATYFAGEDDIPVDNESLEIIKQVTGLPAERIKGTGKDETFWSLGAEGSPGGPTVEFYIDGIEIWNLVFNEYIFQNGKYIPSKLKGVDTGMGLERLAAIMQGKDDVYETDLFWPIIEKIEELSGKKYQGNKKAFRVIADHLKAATFLLSEGIAPSNKDQGYITRRLIRRAIVKASEIGIKENFTTKIAKVVFGIYKDLGFCCHPELDSGSSSSDNRPLDSRLRGNDTKGKALSELEKEETKFRQNLSAGLKIINSQKEFTAKVLFDLYQSYGLPVEVTIEEADKAGHKIDNETMKQYDNLVHQHQELSRTASAGRFKGGLADSGEETTKLHTAAHLLLAALREIYGMDTNQKGSNITAERLRFDFNHTEKMMPEEIKKVEDIVNENIKADLPVTMEEMLVKEAKESGATGVFDDRYGDKVKVYTIGDINNPVSREICGGPHIEHTSQLGHFKITKEESSSAGVRRVKAVLK